MVTRCRLQATKSLDTSTSCISRTLAEQSLVGVLLATGLSGLPQGCQQMQGSASDALSSRRLHLHVTLVIMLFTRARGSHDACVLGGVCA